MVGTLLIMIKVFQLAELGFPLLLRILLFHLGWQVELHAFPYKDSKTYALRKLSYCLLTFSTAFLISLMVGIPGVKALLLEEYGVRLVTYDLPGFGESDPHPNRNFNSSAMDMLHLVNAVNVTEKFWVLCHSSGCIHAWASLRYIPERIAGSFSLFKFFMSRYL